MANAFGIISALVLAVTAYLGFTNKKALVNQVEHLANQDRNFAISNKSFDEKGKSMVDLREEIKAANDENATLTEQLETQLATNKTLQTSIGDKKSLLDSKKVAVEEGEEKLARFGNLDDLKNNLEKIGTDLATLNGELLLKNTEIQTRTALNDTLGTENAALSDVLGRYAKKQSAPGLQVRVTQVVNELGFVLLSGGDNAGIVRDSTLEVQRDGQTIGKLVVTGTQLSSAAASMVPDSFSEGMSIRTGDLVVSSKN